MLEAEACHWIGDDGELEFHDHYTSNAISINKGSDVATCLSGSMEE